MVWFQAAMLAAIKEPRGAKYLCKQWKKVRKQGKSAPRQMNKAKPVCLRIKWKKCSRIRHQFWAVFSLFMVMCHGIVKVFCVDGSLMFGYSGFKRTPSLPHMHQTARTFKHENNQSCYSWWRCYFNFLFLNFTPGSLLVSDTALRESSALETHLPVYKIKRLDDSSWLFLYRIQKMQWHKLSSSTVIF